MEAVSQKFGRNTKISMIIILFLIGLFFAIPICGMAICERVTSWPKVPISFFYSLFEK